MVKPFSLNRAERQALRPARNRSGRVVTGAQLARTGPLFTDGGPIRATGTAPVSDAGSAGGEPGRFVGAAGGVAGAVGVGAGSGELAAVDDQVLLADRAAVEPALEDLAHPGGVAGLRREARARGVGRHPVVRHRPPR